MSVAVQAIYNSFVKGNNECGSVRIKSNCEFFYHSIPGSLIDKLIPRKCHKQDDLITKIKYEGERNSNGNLIINQVSLKIKNLPLRKQKVQIEKISYLGSVSSEHDGKNPLNSLINIPYGIRDKDSLFHVIGVILKPGQNKSFSTAKLNFSLRPGDIIDFSFSELIDAAGNSDYKKRYPGFGEKICKVVVK